MLGSVGLAGRARDRGTYALREGTSLEAQPPGVSARGWVLRPVPFPYGGGRWFSGHGTRKLNLGPRKERGASRQKSQPQREPYAVTRRGGRAGGRGEGFYL